MCIAVLVIGDAPLETGFLERPILLVDEEKITHRVIGHEYVHKAIAVEIRDGNAHSLAQLLSDARRVSDIFEAAIAEVVIETVRDAGIDLGMAIVFLPVHGADL